MKTKLILFFLLIINLLAAAQKNYKVNEIPNPKKQGANYYVSNPDGVLNNISSLNSLLSSFESETKIEFAIVVVKDFDRNADEFDFALDLFRKWGIGKKESNNGLLLFIATNRKKYRFITGYGLEGDLPDAILKRLASNNLVPYFKQKQYSEGVESVTNAVINAIKDKQSVASQPVQPLSGSDHTETLKSEAYPQTESGSPQPAYAVPYNSNEQSPAKNIATNNFSHYYGKFKNNTLAVVLSIFAVLFLTVFSVIQINKYAPYDKNSTQSRIKFSKKYISGGCLIFVLFFIGNFFWFSNSGSFFSASNLYKVLTMLYIIMLISLYSWYTSARMAISSQYFDDESYQNELKVLNKKFWWFFVANPLLLIVLFKQIKKQKQLKTRFKPILDSHNNPMQRLNRDTNQDGLPYINKGQHKEEELGVNDYDIWQNANKNEFKLMVWPEDNYNDYNVCPKCKFKTFSKPIVITIKAATYSHTGTAKQVLECYNCKYEELIKNIVIPMKVESSSSSSSGSSSSSSSSSSSFGGGSSGGGGAGGSW